MAEVVQKSIKATAYIVETLFPSLRETVRKSKESVTQVDLVLSDLEQTVAALSVAKSIINLIDYEGSNLLFIMLDAQGNIQYVTKNWERFLGYSSREMVGRYFMDFISEHSVESTKAIWNSIQDTGKTIFDFENEYARKNGGHLSLTWHVTIDPETKYVLGMATVYVTDPIVKKILG